MQTAFKLFKMSSLEESWGAQLGSTANTTIMCLVLQVHQIQEADIGDSEEGGNNPYSG